MDLHNHISIVHIQYWYIYTLSRNTESLENIGRYLKRQKILRFIRFDLYVFQDWRFDQITLYSHQIAFSQIMTLTEPRNLSTKTATSNCRYLRFCIFGSYWDLYTLYLFQKIERQDSIIHWAFITWRRKAIVTIYAIRLTNFAEFLI